MRTRKILKASAMALAALAVVAALGVAAVLYLMARKDREHARFFETGRSVNNFLSGYTGAVKEGFEKRDVPVAAALYSDHFASPARGRWVLRADADEGEVAVSRLVAEGRQDCLKDELRGEVARYFDTLSSIRNVWTKIDMIEQVEPGRRVVLRVKFILDGTDPRGRIFQDRHFYRWTLDNQSGAPGRFDWRIARDELIEGVRVSGDGGGFREVDLAAAGLDFRHARDPKLDADLHSARMKFDVIMYATGGVAVADFDGDGRLDLVVNNNNETPTLYLNNPRRSGNAVELKLVGTRSNRDALGARVRLTAGGRTMTRQVEAGSGYGSQSMRTLHFGLGAAEHIEAGEVNWPSGRVQRIGGGELRKPAGAGRLVTIKESPDALPDVVVRAGGGPGR